MGYKVTHLDITPGMLSKAEEKAKSKGLNKENMIIKDVRSIGSLSQLYLIHLYRQYSNEEVRKKINNLSYEKEFIELCDKFDKDILNKGIGSFRRAGIIAIAEKPAIIIEETKEVPMKLLLMADPEINAVNKYINESLIFIAQNYEEVIGVIAIKKINEEIYEIMNLAVDNAYRGKGVGKKLINKAVETVKALGGRKIIIGTGNSSIIPLMIYQKAGFTIYEIKKNFFIDNYRDEIWENGIRCTDMIMLEKNI